MTNAGVSDTEKWIADKGAKYAYGYDKSGKFASYFNVTGIPRAVLFDPSGKVVWDGHPASLTDADIEKAVNGALPKMPWEWEAALQPAAKLLGKRQYASAIAEARKVGVGADALIAAVRAVVKGNVEGIKSAKTEGDFLAVSEDGAALVKSLNGLPEEVEVATLLKELAADKEAQKVIAAQKQVRNLTAEEPKKRDLPVVLKKLEKLKKDNEGNAAGRDATAAIETLKKP